MHMSVLSRSRRNIEIFPALVSNTSEPSTELLEIFPSTERRSAMLVSRPYS